MSVFAGAWSQNEDELKKEQSAAASIAENAKTERPKFCVHCGAPLEDGDEFCTECGHKIESEIVAEEQSAARTSARKESRSEQKISSDRMASIKETGRVKEGGAVDLLKKNKGKPQGAFKTEIAKSEVKATTTLKTGWYMCESRDQRMYLIIESVSGGSVCATLKTTFYNGGYATSCWTGTLAGDSLSLTVQKKDLHPLPEQRWETFTDVTTITHSILVCDYFSGTVFQDRIIVNSADGCETFLVFARQ